MPTPTAREQGAAAARSLLNLTDKPPPTWAHGRRVTIPSMTQVKMAAVPTVKKMYRRALQMFHPNNLNSPTERPVFHGTAGLQGVADAGGLTRLSPSSRGVYWSQGGPQWGYTGLGGGRGQGTIATTRGKAGISEITDQMGGEVSVPGPYHLQPGDYVGISDMRHRPALEQAQRQHRVRPMDEELLNDAVNSRFLKHVDRTAYIEDLLRRRARLWRRGQE